ncbi:hypothetical protein BU26DRAFT_508979 [Trematosphaeria pertusa]|uniref:Uncharacterized protein n=1 Tax=Trematosphaeria pertusa TaxID=390896 RepID=A0A6A6I166_9PLEO|nr:uncharacterized protein BU26DRAFT_508979 [Trematosphaeria pertusa]KAF2244016.1 hypothetical protein BU26DRAFT_508979 [Trematosphaeria pertusa]
MANGRGSFLGDVSRPPLLPLPSFRALARIGRAALAGSGAIGAHQRALPRARFTQIVAGCAAAPLDRLAALGQQARCNGNQRVAPTRLAVLRAARGGLAGTESTCLAAGPGDRPSQIALGQIGPAVCTPQPAGFHPRHPLQSAPASRLAIERTPRRLALSRDVPPACGDAAAPRRTGTTPV